MNLHKQQISYDFQSSVDNAVVNKIKPETWTKVIVALPTVTDEWIHGRVRNAVWDYIDEIN